MIKKLLLLATLLLTPVTLLAQEESVELPNIYNKGFKFCEGTVPYKGMILVSNFGTETLDPLNNQGKGYIMAIDGAKVREFIPADGNLSAPKGMLVLEGHLFIADVNKVVVYNLRKLNEAPSVIKFPEEDMFVNDIVAIGKMILVSVTNTGRVYGLDASDMNSLSNQKPMLLGDVPGANGMAVNDNKIYIASYNPTGTPSKENVIYVADITKPEQSISKLIEGLPAGQYDGIAVSEDGNKLIFSSWTTSANAEPALWIYNLVNNTAARVIDYGTPFQGPADICVKNGSIWIPDLPSSTIYRFDM